MIFQAPARGRYASGLIGGRYQVLECPAVGGTFLVVDLKRLPAERWDKDDRAFLRDRGGTPYRFHSAEDARELALGQPR